MPSMFSHIQHTMDLHPPFPGSKEVWELRSITNLRPLNAYITLQRLRMEALSTVLQSLQKKWWAISISLHVDLKDAYLHVSFT